MITNAINNALLIYVLGAAIAAVVCLLIKGLNWILCHR